MRFLKRAWALAMAPLVVALALPPAMPVSFNGVLRLAEARSNALLFYVEINPERECPKTMDWMYKREEDTQWIKREKSMTLENSVCRSLVILDNLNASTRYFVNVRVRETRASPGNWNWNKQRNFFAQANHLTCPHDVPEVKHLVISSTNSSSVGLSWIPPRLQCKTRLEYVILFHSPGEETFVMHPKGVFWSNSLNLTDSFDGEVKHCAAWPERHCLLVDSKHFKLNRHYIVEVAVNRVADHLHSNHVNTTFKFTGKEMVPEPPLELRCVRAEARALVLRWRYPLRPGGPLRGARGAVWPTLGPGARHPRFFWKQMGRGALYEQRVDQLQPDMQYNVSVHLETAGGVLGQPATLQLWTTSPGRLAEGECPSPSPPNGSAGDAGVVESQTTGGPKPQITVGGANVTASDGADGVGSRNASDVAEPAFGDGNSVAGGAASIYSGERKGCDEVGIDGTLSWWAWVPGICIFLIFLITLLIMSSSRLKNIICGPSKSSSSISIINEVPKEGCRTVVTYNEAFLGSIVSPTPIRMSNDYDSIISENSRNLWAQRILPSISSFSRSVSPFIGRQGAPLEAIYANAGAQALRKPLDEEYLAMDGGRRTSAATSSYVLPNDSPPRTPPRRPSNNNNNL